jgi:ferritin
MGIAEGMGRLAREVIASFEARVSSVEQIIEATHEMLETFRSQREAVRAQLRETLARAASLRRRDFDAMMNWILAHQQEREKRVKDSMREYLQEQRALASTMREALEKSEAGRTESVRELLGGITARREAREQEIRSLLAEFRRDQEETARALQALLSNGGSIKVKEFKAALSAIQSRCWSRKEEGGRVAV